MGTEILYKGKISREKEAGPGEATNQQRAPRAGRGARESQADARPWPSCPGSRLPLRSSRETGGLSSEVKVKTPF